MIAFLIKALFFCGFWGEKVKEGVIVELCEGSPGSPRWCRLHHHRQWHSRATLEGFPQTGGLQEWAGRVRETLPSPHGHHPPSTASLESPLHQAV